MMYVDHSNTVGAALSFKLFVPSFFTTHTIIPKLQALTIMYETHL